MCTVHFSSLFRDFSEIELNTYFIFTSAEKIKEFLKILPEIRYKIIVDGNFPEVTHIVITSLLEISVNASKYKVKT
jgi:hypothetical protein